MNPTSATARRPALVLDAVVEDSCAAYRPLSERSPDRWRTVVAGDFRSPASTDPPRHLRRDTRERAHRTVSVKHCVDRGLDLDLPAGLKLERELWINLVLDGGLTEGAAAFFGKRDPVYPD